MIEMITSIEVNNKSTKNEKLIICTEWDISKIKFLIISGSNTFMGEANFDDLSNYAKEFDKYQNLDEFMEETKEILSKSNDEIDFYLKDDQFFWKRKKFALGKINVKPVEEVKYVAGFTKVLIDYYSKIAEDKSILEKSNQKLKNLNLQLTNQLNDMIILKNQLETKTYKNSALVINTKKERIRILENELKTIRNKDSVYDAATDESENELQVSSDFKSDIKNNSSLNKTFTSKRLLDEGIENKKEKRIKSDINITNQEIDNFSIDNEPIASTSTDKKPSLQEDEETPDFLSDESECDMELKLDDEKVEEETESKLNTTIEENSSEEMF